MAQTSNVVNLDALIRRADLASPGETGEDIDSLSIMGLVPKGMLYPAICKPDFQRETANWTPDQVATLIATFARRDLIPAIILWRAGNDVFVIDGAHRLSAIIAWVHDDYGDGEASRRFFQNAIPEDQARAATRTRDLVKAAIGSYADHKIAIEYPENSRPDVAERANRIAWQPIPAQWIRDADHEKAEKAFFRINQGGTKIDPVERRILAARRSATALAARAILRGGAGHNYWKGFSTVTRARIEELGGEIHRLLFEPPIDLPLRTLDLPMGGHGYGPKALPFVFDLVNVVNRVQVKDSSNKRASDDEGLVEDGDGSTTIAFMTAVLRTIQRICSSHPSSLGLHPALYFYARSGTFQPASLLGYVLLFADWSTEDFLAFTRVRSQYEEFVLSNGGLTEAVRRLGSGARSRPRMLAWHREVIKLLLSGKTASEVATILRDNPDFEFFVTLETHDLLEQPGSSFSREIKGAAYLRDALPSAPRCPTCGGLMHRNGMQVGHQKAKRDGGRGDLANAMMQHPFCNSTVAN